MRQGKFGELGGGREHGGPVSTSFYGPDGGIYQGVGTEALEGHVWWRGFLRFIATLPASQLLLTKLIEIQNDLFNKEKNRQLALTP